VVSILLTLLFSRKKRNDFYLIYCENLFLAPWIESKILRLLKLRHLGSLDGPLRDLWQMFMSRFICFLWMLGWEFRSIMNDLLLSASSNLLLSRCSCSKYLSGLSLIQLKIIWFSAHEQKWSNSFNQIILLCGYIIGSFIIKRHTKYMWLRPQILRTSSKF
jgi:hypothetical protein